MFDILYYFILVEENRKVIQVSIVFKCSFYNFIFIYHNPFIIIIYNFRRRYFLLTALLIIYIHIYSSISIEINICVVTFQSTFIIVYKYPLSMYIFIYIYIYLYMERASNVFIVYARRRSVGTFIFSHRFRVAGSTIIRIQSVDGRLAWLEFHSIINTLIRAGFKYRCWWWYI